MGNDFAGEKKKNSLMWMTIFMFSADLASFSLDGQHLNSIQSSYLCLQGKVQFFNIPMPFLRF